MKEKMKKISLFVVTMLLVGIIAMQGIMKVDATDYNDTNVYRFMKFKAGDKIKCTAVSCRFVFNDNTNSPSATSNVSISQNETYTFPSTSNRSYTALGRYGVSYDGYTLEFNVWYVETPEEPEEVEETPEVTTTTKKATPTTTTTTTTTTKKIEKVEEPVKTGVTDYIWIMPIILVAGYFIVTKINKNKKFNNL